MYFDMRLKNTMCVCINVSLYLHIRVSMYVCLYVCVCAWQPGNNIKKNVAHLKVASTSQLLRKIPPLTFWSHVLPTQHIHTYRHTFTSWVHNVYLKDTKSASNLNVLRNARARERVIERERERERERKSISKRA